MKTEKILLQYEMPSSTDGVKLLYDYIIQSRCYKCKLVTLQ